MMHDTDQHIIDHHFTSSSPNDQHIIDHPHLTARSSLSQLIATCNVDDHYELRWCFDDDDGGGGVENDEYDDNGGS